jgi:membrane protease subunit (stomatin/prohibitin family)
MASKRPFLEIIEWFDSSGAGMVQRIPPEGSGDIKYGAQLTVRESQVGVFFYEGKAIHAFGPGRHTLKTGNIPILYKLMSIPWGMQSPLRAEVYFVNTKVFVNLKWGTRDPVAFKDRQFGLVRLRAFGHFNIRIVQPLLFINSLVGTLGQFATENVEQFLGRVIVSRLNDYMGENLQTLMDLPALYDEWAAGMKERLQEDFVHYGLCLEQLYINSITPTPEVQKAIDDSSKLNLFGDLDRLVKMKAAMALEKAASGASSEAAGTGLGLMLPALLLRHLHTGEDTPAVQKCPDCNQRVPLEAYFCPFCSHQLVVFHQCDDCGKNLAPNARYCPSCGRQAQKMLPARSCSQCGGDNLNHSVFCNACGERL